MKLGVSLTSRIQCSCWERDRRARRAAIAAAVKPLIGSRRQEPQRDRAASAGRGLLSALAWRPSCWPPPPEQQPRHGETGWNIG